MNLPYQMPRIGLLFLFRERISSKFTYTTGVTSGAGTVNPCGAPSVLVWLVLLARSFVFCVVFCRSLFVLLAIAFSDYPFGIFQLFLQDTQKNHVIID